MTHHWKTHRRIKSFSNCTDSLKLLTHPLFSVQGSGKHPPGHRSGSFYKCTHWETKWKDWNFSTGLRRLWPWSSSLPWPCYGLAEILGLFLVGLRFSQSKCYVLRLSTFPVSYSAFLLSGSYNYERLCKIFFSSFPFKRFFKILIFSGKKEWKGMKSKIRPQTR